MRLLSRTDFNFANVQGNQTVTVWPTQDIDVSRYREGTMLVRVHSSTIGPTATLVAALRSALPSKEDPAQFFRGTTDLRSAWESASESGCPWPLPSTRHNSRAYEHFEATALADGVSVAGTTTRTTTFEVHSNNSSRSTSRVGNLRTVLARISRPELQCWRATRVWC
jgi:hypothetical protein